MVNKFKLGQQNSTSTQNAITRTLEIANSYAGELSIEVLTLDRVELDPENKRDLVLTLADARNGISKDDPEYDRKKRDWKSLESLAKTIKEGQLINPIFVYRYGNMCRLIAGERRTLATAIAGKSEIIARISEQRPVGTKLRILQWTENNERADLSLTERVASLEAIVDSYKAENIGKKKVSIRELSRLASISVTQAARYHLILQSQPEIRQAINEGKLENLKLIQEICLTKNAEHQKVLLDEAIAGRSREDILLLKKELELGEKHQDKRYGVVVKKNVSLGVVKPGLAKIILNALRASDSLPDDARRKLDQMSANIEWENLKEAEVNLKKVLSAIGKVLEDG